MKTDIKLTITRWDGKNPDAWNTVLKGKAATNYLEKHKLGNYSWEEHGGLPKGVIRITFSSTRFGFTIGVWQEGWAARCTLANPDKRFLGEVGRTFTYPPFK